MKCLTKLYQLKLSVNNKIHKKKQPFIYKKNMYYRKCFLHFFAIPSKVSQIYNKIIFFYDLRYIIDAFKFIATTCKFTKFYLNKIIVGNNKIKL